MQGRNELRPLLMDTNQQYLTYDKGHNSLRPIPTDAMKKTLHT